MSTFDETLHPRGQAGNLGQFKAKENRAPTATLEAPRSGYDTFIEAKRQALLARGFVPATPGPSTAGTPRTRAGIRNWWRDAHSRSELRTDGKSYHQMPDDYTPGELPGRSLTGKRRTYRKLYQSGEIALRMPSATAIRRYSKEIGSQTFDVPITAEGPAGNPVSGHVRITETTPGRYSVTAINMPVNAQEKVAEAVNAVLENRRPSIALSEVERNGGLLARARARRTAAGTKTQAIDNSDWINAVGYNRDSGEIVLSLQGRHYGYEVPEGIYEYVTTAPSAGKAYNALIKGKYPSHQIDQCDTCSAWTRMGEEHTCYAHRAPTGDAKPHNDRVRAYVMGGPVQ